MLRPLLSQRPSNLTEFLLFQTRCRHGVNLNGTQGKKSACCVWRKAQVLPLFMSCQILLLVFTLREKCDINI